MKLFFASDLHGSALRIAQLSDRIAEEQPSRVILLGDLLYHGPRNDLPPEYDTRAAARFLNSLTPPPLCIRGNCDGEVDQMVLSFPMLADFAWIAAGDRSFYLTHGHRLDDAMHAVEEGGVILFGHTHIPGMWKREGRIIINPGSVSIPKEGSEPSYLLWEDGFFTWKNVITGAVLKTETL